MKRFKWQNLLFGVGFVVLYFVALRLVRIWIAVLVVFPVATSIDSGRENGLTAMAPAGQTGIYVYQDSYLESYEDRSQEAVESGPVGMANYGAKPYYVYKGFGDQFFLFAGFLLIVLGFFRETLYLYGFHVGISLLNTVLLFIGLFGCEIGLQVMDFNIEYLTPAVSLLWIIVVYGNWKTAHETPHLPPHQVRGRAG
jgi:hypothetical protein